MLSCHLAHSHTCIYVDTKGAFGCDLSWPFEKELVLIPELPNRMAIQKRMILSAAQCANENHHSDYNRAVHATVAAQPEQIALHLSLHL